MIRCETVTKSFGSVKVIDDLSLTINHGSSLITGANGSGKSTLLMLIAGIEQLDSGTIECDRNNGNKRLISVSSDSIREPGVFTLQELLSIQKKYNDLDENLLSTLIKSLELTPFIHQRIDKVSTGTRKKFSVICALAKRSDLLILDEPFNGLDAYSKDTLAKFIEADNRDKILVDHTQSLTHDAVIPLSVEQ